MAKKNPYVTTIGFNKEDPDHVYVADFLNSMGRGKGQYIVKAIMAYQNPEGASAGQVVVQAVDYEKIRAFVVQVMEEKAKMSVNSKVEERPKRRLEKVREEYFEKVELQDLDETAMNDILASLSVFR